MYFTGIVNSAFHWSRRFSLLLFNNCFFFSIQISIYICVVFFLSVYNRFRVKLFNAVKLIRNHGEEFLAKHKDPTVRKAFALTKEVRGMHFAPFLFYQELDRVFVMIISTFTLLIWLVMIRH